MKTRILIGLVVILLMTGSSIAAQEPPQVIIDRLDCDGWMIHLEGGNPEFRYWINVYGVQPQSKWGFAYAAIRLRRNEQLEERWPFGWKDYLHNFGVSYWTFEVWDEADLISRIEGILNCEVGTFKSYLPFIPKGAE